MKKKGFTLIELLAVIIVLSIIALITIPVVTSTIKNAKKGAAEVSIQNYIRAVELTISNSELNKKHIPDGTYDIDSDGNLKGEGLPDGKLVIDASGDKPTSGTIVIKSGQVTTDSKMTIGDYDVAYNPTSKVYEATEKGSAPQTIVYRWSTDTINIGDTIDPSDTTKFTTNPSTLGKRYYLKHVLDKGNEVTESYVCAIFNSKEYCVRGGDESFYGYAENESNYTGNALILKQIEDTKIEEVSCTFRANASYCYDGSVTLDVPSNGYVRAGDIDGCCSVIDDGISNCGYY